MANQIPHVDYLVLGDKPHLVANECTSCGARFFDRRNACAKCFKNEFKKVAISTDGVLKSFTIVAFAAPGVPVPFVAGIIDCGGTSVRGNVINTDPTPEKVSLGMKVRLATFSLGTVLRPSAWALTTTALKPSVSASNQLDRSFNSDIRFRNSIHIHIQ
jgi:uncharacterized OB-fold protein